jgi:hypothetical protein
VIVAKAPPTGAFDCSPQFNFFYRYLYLLLAFLAGVSGIVAYPLSGRYEQLIAVLVISFWAIAVLPVFKMREKQARIEHLGIIFTPLIPIGSLLMLATLFPILKITLGLLATALGGWMWYRRLTMA